MAERAEEGPLIDLERNEDAVKRRKSEFDDGNLRRSYNSTLAPSPITIGTMGVETVNGFYEAYVYSMYIFS